MHLSQRFYSRDARLSLLATLFPGCLSCLLRETPSIYLSFTLIFWQTAASSSSRGPESRDGTINASTNDDAIYRRDFNTRPSSACFSRPSLVSRFRPFRLSSPPPRSSPIVFSISMLHCTFAALHFPVVHRDVPLSYRCMCTRDAFAARKCGWTVQRPARIPRAWRTG